MRLFFVSLTTIFSLLIIAQPALAQTNSAQCDKLRQQFNSAGGGDLVGNNALPAYCNPTSIFTKIVNILYYVVGIASVIAIIYGGFLYMTARGNALQAHRGRTVLTWAIIGLAIAILAAVIVNVVVKFIVDNG